VGHSKSEQNLLRGCTNREIRKLMAAVFSTGTRYRASKGGIIVYGPPGTKPISIHLTVSDHRAVKNLSRDLRQIGIELKGKK
jgi:hypothetical protein